MQVFVRDNDIDQALRSLKRKVQREGVFKEPGSNATIPASPGVPGQ